MITQKHKIDSAEEFDKSRFPIGQYAKAPRITRKLLKNYILDIGFLPGKLKKEVSHLTNQQLDAPYRPNGWCIRQLVHHCADAHMIRLVRIKLALTEDKPTIKPYSQDSWAALPDSIEMPIESSLQLLDAVHLRCVFLLNKLKWAEWTRSFVHPEFGIEFPLNEYVGDFAWHGNHHLAQIVFFKKSKNWR